MKSFRIFALLLVLGLLAAACGQKPGVHNLALSGGAGGGGVAAGASEEAFADSDGDGVDDSTGLSADEFTAAVDSGQIATADTGGGGTTAGGGATTGGGGSTTPAGTASGGGSTGGGSTGGGGGGSGGSGGSGGGGSGGGGSGGGGGGGGGSAPQGPGDTTGISSGEIKIGLHAPLSGAAPLPQQSFNSGKDQYWEHIGKINGRKVTVIVRNDEYNPGTAKRVCDEMIQKDKVFVLIGGGGADQIATCARTAAQQGVPYLSAGVDEGVLRQLPNYFALSHSYPQQVPLIMDYVKKNADPSNDKFAILRDRTPSFNNVVAAMQQAAGKAGYKVLVRQISSAASDATWLRTEQIEVAFPIMAPSAFVQIVGADQRSGMTWVGAGITMGLNTVANAACGSSRGNYKGMFLSPFPGLDVIDRLDPEFRKAGGRDDIELALWGLNKTIHQVIVKSGKNLSRQSFVQALENNQIKSGVYPDLRHSSSNHFGATSMHALISDCGSGTYKTLKPFATKF